MTIDGANLLSFSDKFSANKEEVEHYFSFTIF